jgi:hypothetical protein
MTSYNFDGLRLYRMNVGQANQLLFILALQAFVHVEDDLDVSLENLSGIQKLNVSGVRHEPTNERWYVLVALHLESVPEKNERA